jgi:hypothetical protein
MVSMKALICTTPRPMNTGKKFRITVRTDSLVRSEPDGTREAVR